MADLQRDVNNVPSVSGPVTPPPPETSTAKLIGELGQQVGSFVVKKKKEKAVNELEEGLKSLGDEVFAARTGKELEKTSARFERLKAGQEQGLLTDTMVKIEAEALLKESIDSMPAFAPELREFASRILNYDPTGAQVRALLDVPKADRNSFQAKQLEEANFIANNLGVDVQDVLKLQAKNMLSRQKADLITNQASIGAADRRDIFNATMQESDSFVSTVMGDLLTQINAGGIPSVEETLGFIAAHKLGHKQALRDRYASAGISPDTTELNREMAAIDDHWRSIEDVAKSGSLGEILKNNSQAIGHAMTVEGYNVLGDLAMHNAMGGQAAVGFYLETVNKYTKPEELALLKSVNPALAGFIKTQDDAAKAAARAYNTVMGVDPTFGSGGNETPVTPEQAEAEKTLENKVHYDLTKNARLSDEEKLRRLSYAKNQGQKYKVLGAYFQKGARRAAADEEVRFVTQTFQEEYPNIVARVASEMANADGITLSVKGGKLVTVDTTLPFFTGHMAPTGSMLSAQPRVKPLSPALDSDLKRANSFINGINNGWGEDFGKNPVTFANDILAEIEATRAKLSQNKERLESAVQKFENEPSEENLEALRRVDPELVASIERAAAARAGAVAGGEISNAN